MWQGIEIESLLDLVASSLLIALAALFRRFADGQISYVLYDFSTQLYKRLAFSSHESLVIFGLQGFFNHRLLLD